MRYALIVAGVVSNIVEWDGSRQFPAAGTLVQSDAANIGDSYNGTTFTPATVTPPPTITLKTRAAAVIALGVRLPPDVVALLALALGAVAQVTITQQPGDPPSSP